MKHNEEEKSHLLHSKSKKYLNTAGGTSGEDNDQGNSEISNQYESKPSSSNNYVSESNVQYQIPNESESANIQEDISNEEENIELLPEASVYKILSNNVAQVKQQLEYLKENKLPYDDPEVLVILKLEVFSVNHRLLRSFCN